MTSDAAVARKAKNEALFRDANERIRALRSRLETVDSLTPFICECEDAACRAVVRLDVDHYEAVRAEPNRFLIAAGHPTTQARVVAEHNGYSIVEKHGTAGEVAEQTDPRGEEN